MSLNFLLPYLQIFNIIITVALNLSPIFIFIPLIKGRQQYKNIPLLVLIFNSLNAICWGCYWYRMAFISPVISNILCWSMLDIFFNILYYLSFFLYKKNYTKIFFIYNYTSYYRNNYYIYFIVYY